MQMRDPGLYQNSAMPSRSFKMHPENAGKSNKLNEKIIENFYLNQKKSIK